MRTHILAGVVLALAAGLIVVLSGPLGLDLDSVALLGGAVGAVVALVPDRTASARLLGFAAGFLAAWIGYVLRAAVLPDTSPGRAAAVIVTVLLCVGVVVLSANRLPLWSLLLGCGTFAGAYELTFAAAPPELVSTSVTTATTLLFNLAVGFLAAALVGGADGPRRSPATEPEHLHRADESLTHDLTGADQ